MPALDGIRVIDFTTAAAGPICSMLLGDFGAEVIKVEPPGGEDGRRWGSARFGPNGQFSSTYLAFNRNKASVVLDLKTSAGQARVRELLASADVVIENFKPGVADRLGVGYDQALRMRPEVIYCSISGFGQNGPLRDRPGYDMLMQAYTGHLSITGEADRPPVRIGHSGVDVLTAAHAAFGIALALRHRDLHGEGQYLETSLYDSGLQLVSHFLADYTGTGNVPGKSGPRFAFLAPYGIFRGADRDFYIGISRDGMWRDFCEEMGLAELADDPRFVDNASRVANQRQLYEVLEAIFASRNAEFWMALGLKLSIPVSLIHTIAEVADQPQAAARNLIVDAGFDGVRTTGIPIKMTRTPGSIRRNAPLLGEDNDRLLTRTNGDGADQPTTSLPPPVASDGPG